jgi:hypothetical protein
MPGPLIPYRKIGEAAVYSPATSFLFFAALYWSAQLNQIGI